MYNRLLQPDLRIMLAENDASGLREFCAIFNPAVIAEVFEGMEPREAWQILAHCDIERQAEIFEYLEPREQMGLVEVIDRKDLTRIIEAMAPDDRVDLLERMDEDRVEALMPLIAQAERSDIRRLLSYPDESAGSIMTTDYASLPENITVREALERLRKQAPDSETIYYVFVLDDERHLHGIISLRELILARPNTLLADIMERDVISVRAEDDQDDAVRELTRYDLLALPVVDAENRLVGIITHDDIMDVMREEATEAAYRQSAVQPLEDSYLSTPLLTIAWKRGVWLLLLSAMAFVTATVLDLYQGISDKFRWLEIFLPLVLASGGNTGSQSATLVIRSLALSEMSREEKRRMARRELLTGLTLGSCVGVFTFTVSLLFRDIGPYEAGVVALTVALVVTMGSVTGSQLPMFFNSIGMDPALMSNPLIASLSDLLGVLIYYNVALLVLGVLSR